MMILLNLFCAVLSGYTYKASLNKKLGFYKNKNKSIGVRKIS